MKTRMTTFYSREDAYCSRESSYQNHINHFVHFQGYLRDKTIDYKLMHSQCGLTLLV